MGKRFKYVSLTYQRLINLVAFSAISPTSSDTWSSSAYTREQLKVLYSAGEDQQRTVSLPPYLFLPKPTESYFQSKQKANKICQPADLESHYSLRKLVLWWKSRHGDFKLTLREDDLNLKDNYIILVKHHPCCTKAKCYLVRGTHQHCWNRLSSLFHRAQHTSAALLTSTNTKTQGKEHGNNFQSQSTLCYSSPLSLLSSISLLEAQSIRSLGSVCQRKRCQKTIY